MLVGRDVGQVDDGDGDVRVVHDVVADAAEDGPPNGALAARAAYDQVGANLQSQPHDQLARLEPPLDARPHVQHLRTRMRTVVRTHAQKREYTTQVSTKLFTRHLILFYSTFIAPVVLRMLHIHTLLST